MDDLIVKMRDMLDTYERWKSVLMVLRSKSMDLSTVSSSTSNASFQLADLLVTEVAGEAAAILTAEPLFENAVLHSWKAQLVGSYTTLISSASSLANPIEEITPDSSIAYDLAGPLKIVVTDPSGGSRQIEIDSALERMISASMELIRSYGSLVVNLKLAGTIDLTNAISSFTDARARVSKHVVDIHEEAKESRVLLQNISKNAAESGDVLEEIRVIAEKVANTISSIQSEQITTAEVVERVKSIDKEAARLQAKIETYEPQFDTYQDTLDKRDSDLQDLHDRLKMSVETSESQIKKNHDISESANAMLAASTTAGLAVGLEEARMRYETRMNSARYGFYFSIGLLVVSVAGAAILQGVGGLMDVPTQDTSNYWGNALKNILIILPATWLTSFFAKSFATNFQLEREYSHKVAMAKSVHGFKLQAPKYEEEITTEVFLGLNRSPGESKTVETAEHPFREMLRNLFSNRRPNAK